MSESMASDPTSVHCSREAAVGLAQQYRAAGKRIGYTSGVFDILHAGHVEYLEYARSRVDVLFVGVNSDASVRANKGPQRPINSEQQRAAVLAGLRAVSHLFIFSERNNNVNIELLRPDLYIKAGDYSGVVALEKSYGPLLVNSPPTEQIYRLWILNLAYGHLARSKAGATATPAGEQR